jgi:hypothetical protein
MTISWKTWIWKLGLGLVVATGGIIASSGDYVIASSGYNLLAQNPPPPPTPEPTLSRLSLKSLKCVNSNERHLILLYVNNVKRASMSGMVPGQETDVNHNQSIQKSATIELVYMSGSDVQSLGQKTISYDNNPKQLTFTNGRFTYTLYYEAY